MARAVLCVIYPVARLTYLPAARVAHVQVARVVYVPVARVVYVPVARVVPASSLSGARASTSTGRGLFCGIRRLTMRSSPP